MSKTLRFRNVASKRLGSRVPNSLDDRQRVLGVQVVEAPRQLETMHAQMPSSRGRGQWHGEEAYSYTRLTDAVTEKGKIHFYGVVADYDQPKETRGTDNCCSITITDTDYHSPGLPVVIFGLELEQMPRVRFIGDIIRIHNAQIKVFNKKPQATVQLKAGGSYVLFDGQMKGKDEPYQTSSGKYSRSPTDIPMVHFFRDWVADNVQALGITEYVARIETIEVGRPFFDLFCKVLHVDAHDNERAPLLYVWDGTECASLPIGAKAAFRTEDKAKDEGPRVQEDAEQDRGDDNCSSRWPSYPFPLPPFDVYASFPKLGTLLPIVTEASSLPHLLCTRGRWVKLRNLGRRRVQGVTFATFFTGPTPPPAESLSVLGKESKDVQSIAAAVSAPPRATDPNPRSRCCNLSQTNVLVMCLERTYQQRLQEESSHIPKSITSCYTFLTSTVYENQPVRSLREVLTSSEVTSKFRCIVRVLAIFPERVHDFCQRSSGGRGVKMGDEAGKNIEDSRSLKPEAPRSDEETKGLLKQGTMKGPMGVGTTTKTSELPSEVSGGAKDTNAEAEPSSQSEKEAEGHATVNVGDSWKIQAKGERSRQHQADVHVQASDNSKGGEEVVCGHGTEVEADASEMAEKTEIAIDEAGNKAADSMVDAASSRCTKDAQRRHGEAEDVQTTEDGEEAMLGESGAGAAVKDHLQPKEGKRLQDNEEYVCKVQTALEDGAVRWDVSDELTTKDGEETMFGGPGAGKEHPESRDGKRVRHNERSVCKVKLALEDATGRLDAFLYGDDGDYFFSNYYCPTPPYQLPSSSSCVTGLKKPSDVQRLQDKISQLLGCATDVEVGKLSMCPNRSPPWIKCCLKSYYLDKARPRETRHYRIFSTILL
ncbi:hypothetical protein CBR_g32246 [Chara braunii]|uniref:Telomeric single stranded DNA binding POT1/Cdc13 domain-containing protein n=1 Tax=Chara braunii TaxID=69332 RepID=A0A388JN36_CHABU|nr:hypothetical protein CBR_g32246 [Chara braunii]|eukprot:GBG59229.1 hypothetical protein CBR_g32246 [Chara braunii]